MADAAPDGYEGGDQLATAGPQTPASSPTSSDSGGDLTSAITSSTDAYGNYGLTSQQAKYYADDIPISRQEENEAFKKEIAAAESTFDQPPPSDSPNMLKGIFPMLAIAAIGGKAARLDATQMFGATSGMVQGYMSGKQDVYDQHLKNYQDAYQKWKDRRDQQEKIFKEMREAYHGRVDADIKALQFARSVTGDQAKVAQNLLKDHEALEKLSANVEHWHEQQMAKDNQDAIMNRFRAIDERRKQELADAAIVKTRAAATKASAANDPGAVEEAAKLWARDSVGNKPPKDMLPAVYKYYKDNGIDVNQIMAGRGEVAMARAELRSLGTKKAGLEGVQNALNQPGGIGDQAEVAAQNLKEGDLRGINQISQILAKQDSKGALAAYRVKLLALRDQYAVVINKGQPPTDAARASAVEAMDQFQPTAVKDIVKAIKQVSASEQEGTETAIQDAMQRMGGPKDTPANAPSVGEGAGGWGKAVVVGQ